jgi:short-subunit dehydrogenase
MFSRFRLTGARTVLTGASSGIGWALAQRLAEHKARLVLASRSQERLESLQTDLRSRGAEAIAIPTDVTDPGQRAHLIESAVTAFGGIDILINNAGVGAMGPFSEANESRLRRVLEVNFFGSVELTRLALPHLRQAGRAMLVNIGSVAGRRGFPGNAEYCASKFALAGWSECLRAEWAPLGIHVLLVSPGLIATDFHKNMIEDNSYYDFERHRIMSADRCARQIVRAMRYRKNEVVITGLGKVLVWANRFVPRLVDYVLVHGSKAVKHRPSDQAQRRPV